MNDMPFDILKNNDVLDVFKYDISRPFREALDIAIENNNAALIKQLKKEVLLFELSTDISNKNYFKPKLTLENEEGEIVTYPNLEKDFDEEMKRYLIDRFPQTKNPIYQSRYADVLWTIFKVFPFVELAVKSYLESSKVYSDKEMYFQMQECLHRGLKLAVSINNEELIRAVIDSFDNTFNELKEKGTLRYTLELTEFLMSQYNVLKKYTLFKFLDIEDILLSTRDYYDQQGVDWIHLKRITLESLSTLYKLEKMHELNTNTKVLLAESFEEEAKWKEENKQYSVASHHYEQALLHYLDITGFRDKVDELKVKIQDCNNEAIKEFQKFEVSDKIPQQVLDKFFSIYEEVDDLNTFLSMIVSDKLIPEWKRCRETAIGITQQSVLSQIMPLTLMRGNITVKEFIEDEDKLEYNTLDIFRNHYENITRIYLYELIQMVNMKDKGNGVFHLINFIKRNGTVNEKRIPIIERGIERYYAGDFISASHLLVFQIEGILRDMLGMLKLPTFSYRNKEMRERMLSDSLDTLSGKGLNEDLVKLISVFLNDIAGDNLRNDLAHGIAGVQVMNPINATLLIFIILKLSSYKLNTGE